MKEAVAFQNREFAARLVPQCEYLLYCPEGKMCCGRKMTYDKTRALIGAIVDVARKEVDRS